MAWTPLVQESNITENENFAFTWDNYTQPMNTSEIPPHATVSQSESWCKTFETLLTEEEEEETKDEKKEANIHNEDAGQILKELQEEISTCDQDADQILEELQEEINAYARDEDTEQRKRQVQENMVHMYAVDEQLNEILEKEAKAVLEWEKAAEAVATRAALEKEKFQQLQLQQQQQRHLPLKKRLYLEVGEEEAEEAEAASSSKQRLFNRSSSFCKKNAHANMTSTTE
nr:hypothetical protein MmNV_81 [Menippe mercenaria nudivirus]